MILAILTLHALLVVPTLTATARAAPAVPANPASPAVQTAPAAQTAAATTDARGLPPNLRVPADLQAHLERLLEVSPTFRRQIALIRGARHVRIRMSYAMRRSSLIDAETVVQKHAHGTLMVHTTLVVPGNLTELVVHELEHVCEQIEGVELAALARQRPGEAREFLGRYETRRARLAGQRAVSELEAHEAAAAAAGAGAKGAPGTSGTSTSVAAGF